MTWRSDLRPNMCLLWQFGAGAGPGGGAGEKSRPVHEAGPHLVAAVEAHLGAVDRGVHESDNVDVRKHAQAAQARRVAALCSAPQRVHVRRRQVLDPQLHTPMPYSQPAITAQIGKIRISGTVSRV